jgi:hypothetical protein
MLLGRRESCGAHPFEFSEKEYDATLVLAQHAKRADKIEDYSNAENVKNIGPVHGVPIWLSKWFRTRMQTKPAGK